MSNELGMDYDMTAIAFGAYITNQIVIQNLPSPTNYLLEFSHFPREKNVSQALEAVL